MEKLLAFFIALSPINMYAGDFNGTHIDPDLNFGGSSSGNPRFEGFDGIHIEGGIGNHDFNLGFKLGNDFNINIEDIPDYQFAPFTLRKLNDTGKTPDFAVFHDLMDIKSPIYSCNKKLRNEDPERYNRISGIYGSYLPIEDPLIDIKRRIDNGEVIYGKSGKFNHNRSDSALVIESSKIENQTSTPVVLKDVGLCQNEKKLECYNLLHKSLTNPIQSKYISNCTESTVTKFKTILGSDGEVKELSCEQTEYMTSEIILALDGHPSARLIDVNPNILLPILKEINPSAHHALECLTNKGKIKLGKYKIDNGKIIGNLSGIIYKDEDYSVGYLPVIVAAATVVAAAATVISSAYEIYKDRRDEKRRLKEEKKTDDQQQEFELKLIEQALKLNEAGIQQVEFKRQKDGQFKLRVYQEEKIRRCGSGDCKKPEGDDKQGGMHIMHPDESGLFLRDLKSFNINYTIAQHSVEEACEKVYNSYESHHFNSFSPIHNFDQEYWEKESKSRKATKWDRGESLSGPEDDLDDLYESDICSVMNIENENLFK